MGEAVRTVELTQVLVVEGDRLPLAEGRRSLPNVDEHVDDLSARAADQLGHAGLEVHAPHDPSARARVVVLDPGVFDAKLGENLLAVGLGEEPPLVAVDRRLQQDRALESGRQRLHGAAMMPVIGG